MNSAHSKAAKTSTGPKILLGEKMNTTQMRDCFVIMPIGIPETEIIWESVYHPTILASGFTPIRVDKNENGKSFDELIRNYINSSPLLIADLTFARPNCYYEIGYAHGQGIEDRMILCCRDDHNPDSPKYRPQSLKIHFDVRQYPMIWWDKDNINDFQSQLSAKIKQRSSSIRPIPVPARSGQPMAHEQSTRLEPDVINAIILRSEKELIPWKKKT